MSKVLCYGGICVDNIIRVPYLPTPGVATTPTYQQYQLGGGAAQTAIWLASWDVNVSLTGNAIGKDGYGDQILSWLGAFDTFDAGYIQQSVDVTTPYTRALVPPNGDRYLIEFGYDTAPMRDAGSINLDDIDILTVNYYYNNPERESQRMAKIAHDNGITVIASDVVNEENGFFASSSILINSRAVMQKVVPDVNHHEYIVDLQAKHGGIVIMTDGENPVWVVNRDGTTFSVEVPRVEVHDATGAGDAFRAGIVYGQLNQWSLEDSVNLAVAAGSLQVKRNASIAAPPSVKAAKSLADTLHVT